MLGIADKDTNSWIPQDKYEVTGKRQDCVPKAAGC